MLTRPRYTQLADAQVKGAALVVVRSPCPLRPRVGAALIVTHIWPIVGRSAGDNANGGVKGGEGRLGLLLACALIL